MGQVDTKCRGIVRANTHLIINLSRDYFYSFRLSTNIKYLASDSNKFRSQWLTYGFRLQSDVGWICKWLVIIMFMHISSGFRLSSNKCVSCLFICFLFVSRSVFFLFFSWHVCAFRLVYTPPVEFLSDFTWPQEKGSLLSSVSWFPLAIYSTAKKKPKKKEPETEERKGLKSRNSKAFYLPCLIFFSLNSLGEFVAAATREMHCHRNHKELFLTLAQRTGKDLKEKRHPRQATGDWDSDSDSDGDGDGVGGSPERHPFHLTERNSWKPLFDQ